MDTLHQCIFYTIYSAKKNDYLILYSNEYCIKKLNSCDTTVEFLITSLYFVPFFHDIDFYDLVPLILFYEYELHQELLLQVHHH